MAPRREPIFLERETYRRRRLIDAVRLLPLVGVLLFLGPLLGSGAAPRSTALGGLYVFSTWLGLIALTALLVRWLARAPGGVGSDPLEPDAAPGGPSTRAGGGAEPDAR